MFKNHQNHIYFRLKVTQCCFSGRAHTPTHYEQFRFTISATNAYLWMVGRGERAQRELTVGRGGHGERSISKPFLLWVLTTPPCTPMLPLYTVYLASQVPSFSSFLWSPDCTIWSCAVPYPLAILYNHLWAKFSCPFKVCSCFITVIWRSLIMSLWYFMVRNLMYVLCHLWDDSLYFLSSGHYIETHSAPRVKCTNTTEDRLFY